MNVIKLKKLDIRPDLESIEADRMLIEQTASYVKNLWQQVNAAEMYVAAGREFKNLREHLKKNSKHDKSRIGWYRAFEKQENKFGLERRQAETYISVYEAFFHVGNMLPTWKLPQSLRALQLLARLKLSAEELEMLLAAEKIGPQTTEAEIRALKKGSRKKKIKKQPLETLPAENAPKRIRIEAAFALLARLGLTVDDLKKEFER